MIDHEIDQRLFGRVTAALLECPSCGEIFDIRAGAWGTGRQRGPRGHPAGVFDPLSAQVRCPRCQGRYVIGIVLYLVEAGERSAEAPKDWQATVRERVRMREQARGRVSGESWRQRRRWRGANQIRGGETT